MASFFQALLNFIPTVAKWLLDNGLWILKKFAYIPFDGILTVVTAFFTALNVSSFVATYALSWVGVPEQLIWFVNAIALPQGVAIITAAIGIRLLINLIPSWATRI
jgi:hypothetical protein